MEIVHVYQRHRADFGRQCKFSGRHAELIVDILPDSSLAEQYVHKDPCDIQTECTPEFSEHEVNTERCVTESRGMNHTEGGWPKDVDCHEVEQVARWRKKTEKDEAFVSVLLALTETMIHALNQNNALNIYEDYFSGGKTHSPRIPPDVKTLNVFRDPCAIKRSVSYLSFPAHAVEGESPFLAVSYSVLEFQKAPPGVSLDSYIWKLDNPNSPAQTISPSSPLVSLEFNPKDPNILFGGCYNGQVAVWDTRKGARPTETSPIEKSHQEPCFRTRFLASKTGKDAFSCSTDGRVLFWDIAKLTEPTDTQVLDVNEVRQGAVTLEYESTLPAKYMCGTEKGTVILVNRKAKNPSEKIASLYPAHHGPVVALERNPFNPRYFLTCGDWTLRIWSEDIRESSILQSKYDTEFVTDGCWSPNRPAVLFVSKADGSVDVWDFLCKTNGPTLSVKVSDSPITCLKLDSTGTYLACGSKDGCVTLLELNEGLKVMQHNEKPQTAAIFDREAAREKIVVSRRRELELKMRAKSAATKREAKKLETGASPVATEGDGDEVETDPIQEANDAYEEGLTQEIAKRAKADAKEVAEKTVALLAAEEGGAAESLEASGLPSVTEGNERASVAADDADAAPEEST